jgi:hypothetical protein
LYLQSGTGKVNFDGFCRIAAHFLEEEDSEAMQEELKEAFRLYDREGKLRTTVFQVWAPAEGGTSPGLFLEESTRKKERRKFSIY